MWMQDRADSEIRWGEVVRQRRRQLGLRQDELAALAGVSVRSVHAVEASKPTVRLDVLLAVTSALGLAVSIGGADMVVDRGPSRDR
jgi:y4mF family transcriptional regulator